MKLDKNLKVAGQMLAVWGLCLTLAQAADFPGGMGGAPTTLGMSSSLAMPADSCAGAPDPVACYKQNMGNNTGRLRQADPNQDGLRAQDVNRKMMPRSPVQPQPPTEFQDFVTASLGKPLPVYGHNLFAEPPDTFAPVDNVPVTADYLIGPGDELVITGWGQVDFDLHMVVDRNGAIELPKVGNVNVAGVRYDALQGYLKNAIGRVFRNFELNVTLGRLRAIQVFVVGQAKRPGVYTVSSLSTLINTLFASGGPSLQGSLRHIQVKRAGRLVSELDMYDFLLKGDKTRDVSLQSGDVIYIPPVGQWVAVSGSVNNAGIYELKDSQTTLAALLELAGGLATTAEGEKVRLERIAERKVRQVDEFPLSGEGLARVLMDGDLIRVSAVKERFENAVTLRGNVASPGRYVFKEGMRVADLIPSREKLIVPGYWKKQNQIGKLVGNFNNSYAGDDLNQQRDAVGLLNDVKHSVAEINWDYAVIERLDKNALSTELIPFNLGKAIAGGASADNLSLQSGDVVTVFSKDDIQVPLAKRSVYVRLEGELSGAGVYKALPGETLRQLVARVGGVTSDGFLFGAELRRESVRVMQQKRMKEMADRMEADIKRNAAAKAQNAINPEDAKNAEIQAAAQTALVNKMRMAQATGRVVLDMVPGSSGVKDLPDVALEDGDTFIVPAKPSMVAVMGMVYNENAFLYRNGKSVGDYLDQAGGPTRDADESRIYLLRADGTVVSSRGARLFSSLSGQSVEPGDTVVVPELLDKFALTKELKDWAQIFYQFALGVGGIKMLRL